MASWIDKDQLDEADGLDFLGQSGNIIRRATESVRAAAPAVPEMPTIGGLVDSLTSIWQPQGPQATPVQQNAVPGMPSVQTNAVPVGGAPAAMPAGQPTGDFPIDRSSPVAFMGSFRPAVEAGLQARGLPTSLAGVIAAIPMNEQGYQAEAPGNNYFGIKGSNPRTGANTGPVGTWEDYGAGRQNIQDTFRAYDSPAESAADFLAFLEDNPRYAPALQIARQTGDPEQFIRAVHQAGYATDPAWADKLLSIARTAPATSQNTSQRPVASGGTPVAMPQGEPSQFAPGSLTPNQINAATGEGLDYETALAVCGPAAAIAFARRNGRNPTMQEAVNLARQVGWTAGQGMAGPQSEQRLLQNMGVASRLVDGAPDPQAVAADVQRGNPVMISTDGHYFVAERYDPETGAFDFGESANVLKAAGGRRWFTLDQLASLGMGAPKASLFMDNPTTPDPSVVAGQSAPQPGPEMQFQPGGFKSEPLAASQTTAPSAPTGQSTAPMQKAPLTSLVDRLTSIWTGDTSDEPSAPLVGPSKQEVEQAQAEAQPQPDQSQWLNPQGFPGEPAGRRFGRTFENAARGAVNNLVQGAYDFAGIATDASGLGDVQVPQIGPDGVTTDSLSNQFAQRRKYFEDQVDAHPEWKSSLNLDRLSTPGTYADPDTYAEVAGQLFPSMLASMASGAVAGLALGRAGAVGVKVFGHELATGAELAGSAVATGLTSAGQTAADLKKLGRSDLEATIGGLISGAAQSMLETISPLELSSEKLGQLWSPATEAGRSFLRKVAGAAKDIAVNAGKEGFEEGSQQFVDNAVQKWFGSPKGWFDQVAENAIIGAIGGGAMGAGRLQEPAADVARAAGSAAASAGRGLAEEGARQLMGRTPQLQAFGDETGGTPLPGMPERQQPKPSELIDRNMADAEVAPLYKPDVDDSDLAHRAIDIAHRFGNLEEVQPLAEALRTAGTPMERATARRAVLNALEAKASSFRDASDDENIADYLNEKPRTLEEVAKAFAMQPAEARQAIEQLKANGRSIQEDSTPDGGRRYFVDNSTPEQPDKNSPAPDAKNPALEGNREDSALPSKQSESGQVGTVVSDMMNTGLAGHSLGDKVEYRNSTTGNRQRPQTGEVVGALAGRILLRLDNGREAAAYPSELSSTPQAAPQPETSAPQTATYTTIKGNKQPVTILGTEPKGTRVRFANGKEMVVSAARLNTEAKPSAESSQPTGRGVTGSSGTKFERAQATIKGDTVSVRMNLGEWEGWPADSATISFPLSEWREGTSGPAVFENRQLIRDRLASVHVDKHDQAGRWDRLQYQAERAINDARQKLAPTTQQERPQQPERAAEPPTGQEQGRGTVGGMTTDAEIARSRARWKGKSDAFLRHRRDQIRDELADPNTAQKRRDALRDDDRTLIQALTARGAAMEGPRDSLRQNDENRGTLGTEGASNVTERGRVPGADAGRDGGNDTQPLEDTRPRPAPRPSEERGAGQPVRAEGPGDAGRGAVVPAGGVDAGRRLGSVDAGDRPIRPQVAPAKRLEAAPATADVVMTNDDLSGRTPVERWGDNLSALKVLQQIRAEGRPATIAEQRILARYSGFGDSAFEHAFRPKERKPNPAWQRRGDELRSLVSKDEYEAIRDSRINANYTSAEVIGAMWGAVDHLGLNGTNLRVLDPSSGSGRFFGMMPPELAQGAQRWMVELDTVTGELAKALFPQTSVQITGFQDAKIPADSFDLAISNVPFSRDVRIGRGQDPTIPSKLGNLALHNYFFFKALQAVRPGGVVAFVTTHQTLDAPTSKSFREYLADQAKLLGAIRLPQDAFVDTAVTTDVVFLQKVEGGEPNAAWVNSRPQRLQDGSTAPINGYYVANPNMVLGEHTTTKGRGLYTGGEYRAVKFEGDDLNEALAIAVQSLPADVVKTVTPDSFNPDLDAVQEAHDVKPGAYVVKDGKLLVHDAVRQALVPVPNMIPSAQQRVIKMMDVRDAARSVLSRQLDPKASDASVKQAQATLRQVYDRFVSEHGPISESYNQSLLRSEPDAPLLRALERREALASLKERRVSEGRKTAAGKVEPKAWDKLITGKDLAALKMPIFTERVITPVKEVTSAETPADALSVVLNERGGIDLARMSELLGGKPEGEILAEIMDAGLVFHDPDGGQRLAEEYLSGDVVTKLARAEEAAEQDADFTRNVSALKAVQPQPLKASEVSIRLGAPWVPEQDINDFIQQLLEGSAAPGYRYVPALAQWTREDRYYAHKTQQALNNATYGATNEHGRSLMDAVSIIDRLLNGKDVVIRMPDPNSQSRDATVVDKDATQKAQAKANEIKAAWTRWMRGKPETMARLVDLYNDKFNREVPRAYDGAHLTFPGMAQSKPPRAHQRNVVWRIVQNGTVLMAHEVGAGKTIAMAAAAMELRRLGLAKKNLFVVPNHLVGQFAQEFLAAYPSANVLVPRPVDFQKAGRQELMARIATGDYDAIVVAQSQFTLLPISEEKQAQLIQRELDRLEIAIREEQGSAGYGGKSESEKELVKAKKRLESRLADMQGKIGQRQSGSLNFEDLGISALFVDEADGYKNLQYVTRKSRVKGLPNTKSQRAFDMYAKTETVREQQSGRGVVFATGTPISNTIAELWTMLRYLAPERLKALGLDMFDAWADVFGDAVSKPGMTATGKYQMVTAFAQFQNAPELNKLFQTVADVVTEDDMPELAKFKPKLRGGERTDVVIPSSPELRAYMASIAHRAETLSTKDPTEDNMLLIASDARKAALDIRLAVPSLPEDPNGKIAKVADRVATVWEREADKRGTQIVFLDMGTPKVLSDEDLAKLEKAEAASLRSAENASEDAEGVAEEDEVDVGGLTFDEQKLVSDVYNRVRAKLVAKGVPAEQIAFIHDAKTKAQKQKLFDDVNDGTVRVLLGSTEKLGAGTNVQQRLAALHHIDVPWRPRDVEQREGRILRQGNKVYGPEGDNSGVEIYRYLTEGSFDSFMWDGVLRKARAIKGMVRRTVTARTIEDADEFVASAAQAAALATGNPDVIRYTEMQSTLGELEAAYAGHQDSAVEYERIIKRTPGEIANLEAEMAALNTAQQEIAAEAGKGFAVTIKGQRFAKRETATFDAMRAAIQDAYSSKEWMPVAALYGSELRARRGWGQRIEWELRRPDGTKLGDWSESYGDVNGRGVLQAIEGASAPSKLTERIKLGRSMVTRKRSTMESAERQKSAHGPFERLRDLERLRADVPLIQAKVTAERPSPGEFATDAEYQDAEQRWRTPFEGISDEALDRVMRDKYGTTGQAATESAPQAEEAAAEPSAPSPAEPKAAPSDEIADPSLPTEAERAEVARQDAEVAQRPPHSGYLEDASFGTDEEAQASDQVEASSSEPSSEVANQEPAPAAPEPAPAKPPRQRKPRTKKERVEQAIEQLREAMLDETPAEAAPPTPAETPAAPVEAPVAPETAPEPATGQDEAPAAPKANSVEDGVGILTGAAGNMGRSIVEADLRDAEKRMAAARKKNGLEEPEHDAAVTETPLGRQIEHYRRMLAIYDSGRSPTRQEIDSSMATATMRKEAPSVDVQPAAPAPVAEPAAVAEPASPSMPEPTPSETVEPPPPVEPPATPPAPPNEPPTGVNPGAERPEDSGDPANADLGRQYGEPMKRETKRMAPGMIEAIRRAYVRAMTDDKVDLNILVEQIEKEHGALPPEFRVDLLARLSPGMAAKVAIDEGLKPHLKGLSENDLAWLDVYLTHLDNLDVAKTMGLKAERESIEGASPFRGKSWQQLQKERQRLRAFEPGGLAENADKAKASARRVKQLEKLVRKHEVEHQQRIMRRAAARGQRVESERLFSEGLTVADSRRALSTMAQELDPKRLTRIEKAAAGVWDFNRRLLQAKVENDVISRELYDELIARYPHYVPTRIVDFIKDPASGGPAVGKSLSLNDTGLRRNTIEGTTRRRENPLASTYRNAIETERVIKQNQVALAMKLLIDADEGLQEEFREAPEGHTLRAGEGYVAGFEGGKRFRYVTGEPMAQALKVVSASPVHGFFRGFMHFWKELITRSPLFVAYQVPMDASSYALREVSRSRSNVFALPRIIADLAAGYGIASRGLLTGEYKGSAADYFKSGGGMTGFNLRDIDAAKEKVYDLRRRHILDVRGPSDIARLVKNGLLFDWSQAIGERIELAPRVASYRRAKRDALSEVESVVAGRDVTMDFQRGGYFAKYLNGLLGFFNVGAQTSATLPRMWKENPKGFALMSAMMLGSAVLIEAAMAGGGGGDDDEWGDIPQNIKDRGLLFKTGGTSIGEDGERRPRYLLLPVRELAPLLIVAREAVRRYQGKEGRSALDLLLSTAMAASPVQGNSASDLFGGFFPEILATPAQLALNHDFFRDRDISTKRNDEQASNLSKGIASALQWVGDRNETLRGLGTVTPSQVEFAARGVGGNVARTIGAASDIGRDRGQQDRGPIDTPIVGGLAGRFVTDAGGERLRRAQDESKLVSLDVRKALREAKVNVTIGAVGSSIEGVPLRRAEQARYQEVANTYTDRQLRAALTGRDFQQARGADRAKIVQQAITAGRDVARQQVLQQIGPREIERRRQEAARKAG